MSRITLGMCTYDDLDGVYFTVQANRLLHPVLEADGEILVIDNNPNSKEGKEIARFCNLTRRVEYVPFTARVGSSVRDEIFKYASSDIVVCVDCHVLLFPGALDALLNYLEGTTRPTLVQGPLVYDTMKSESAFWNDSWKRGMLGTWSDPKPLSGVSEGPIEITNMGLGAFAAKRHEWPGFNPLFRGFGGEEGYIQKKYSLLGGRAVSLPAFKWLHRFYRPRGQPYPSYMRDTIFNYLVGCFELNELPDRVIEYFSPRIGSSRFRRIFEEARSSFIRYEEGKSRAMKSPSEPLSLGLKSSLR